MALLWSQDQGLIATEINNLAKEKTWKNTSIHLILNSLLDKRAIIVDGMVRSGRTYSRVFKSAITPEEYSLGQIKQNASYSKDKKSFISNLLISLIDSDEVNMDTIAKIEEKIKKKTLN